MHITMAFIGSIREEKILPLINELETVQKKLFEMKFTEMCYVPNNRRNAKMIWAKGEDREISFLEKKIEKKLLSSNINYTPDERGFTPHITLGRIRSWEWKRLPLVEIPLLEEEIEISFSVNSFELMESELKRGGAIYKEMKRFALRPE